ncbi:hypothetical protein AGMMS49992_04080 [Clostridia bacterium]|nr:hypothetical protein AGMMS49992_04080 [Clostridia bacterium]
MRRKMPKYRPIHPRTHHTERRDVVMGFMAVILILSLMAGGAVALVLTGVFSPALLENPLIEQPSDELALPPQPTMNPAANASAVLQGSGIVYQIASSSGKITAVTEEQLEELKKNNQDDNFDAYATIEDPWDVEGVINSIVDLTLPPITESNRITIKKNALDPNAALPDDWTNILLLGTDDRDPKSNSGRTDTMIIASINQSTGQVKLSSLARDLYVEIPNLGGKQRINVAHAFGGPNLAMKTVNTLFDMNVTRYVRVNLHGLVDIISVFGGAVIDLIPGEAEQINDIVATAEDYEGFEKNPDRIILKKGQVGPTKLDPLQTMAYARIRHIDSDFARTNRQRVVLEKLLEMVMGDANPQQLMIFANVLMPYTTTNISLSELVTIAVKTLVTGLQPIEYLSLPLEGSYSFVQAEAGESVLDANLTRNKTALHEFIYGQYIPKSSK